MIAGVAPAGHRRVPVVAGVVVTVAPFWADGKMLDGLRRATEKSQQMNHVSLLSLAQQAVRTQPVAARVAPLFTLGQSCGVRAQSGTTGYLNRDHECLPVDCGSRFRSAKRLSAGRATILFVVLALVVVVAVARGRPLEAAAVDTLLLFLLLMTNLYPWYLIPIVALLALHSDRLSRGYLFAATALGLAYYPAMSSPASAITGQS